MKKSALSAPRSRGDIILEPWRVVRPNGGVARFTVRCHGSGAARVWQAGGLMGWYPSAREAATRAGLHAGGEVSEVVGPGQLTAAEREDRARREQQTACARFIGGYAECYRRTAEKPGTPDEVRSLERTGWASLAARARELAAYDPEQIASADPPDADYGSDLAALRRHLEAAEAELAAAREGGS